MFNLEILLTFALNPRSNSLRLTMHNTTLILEIRFGQCGQFVLWCRALNLPSAYFSEIQVD